MIKLSFSCTEDLGNAPVTNCGQFCTLCQHEVHDFRGKSNDEIKAILINEPKVVCGTFDRTQAVEDARTKVNWLFRLAFAAVFVFGFNTTTLFGQDKGCETSAKVELVETTESATTQVAGIIQTEGDQPLSGATVWFMSGDVRYDATTDEKGNFVLEIPDEFYGQEVEVYFNAPYYVEESIIIKSVDVKQYVVLVKMRHEDNMIRGKIAYPHNE